MNLSALIPKLQQLYNGALSGTGGNAPLTDAEARAMANQILWFADPRLIKVVMKDDEPVGFSVRLSGYLRGCSTHQRQDISLWLDIHAAEMLTHQMGQYKWCRDH